MKDYYKTKTASFINNRGEVRVISGNKEIGEMIITEDKTTITLTSNSGEYAVDKRYFYTYPEEILENCLEYLF